MYIINLVKLFIFVTALWYTSAYTKVDETTVKRIEHLEKIVEKQSKIIETLTITTEQQHQVIFEIQKDLQHYMETFEQKTKDEVNNVLNTNTTHYYLHRNIRQSPEHTAFTAYMDLGLKHLHNGETLIFNRAVYNEGNAYNTANGIFTCKISGVYLFSFFMGANGTDKAVLKIVIDGSNQIDAIAEATQALMDIQGGNVLITYVTAGQSVWVVQYFEDDGVVRGHPDYRFTTFAGVLLY